MVESCFKALSCGSWFFGPSGVEFFFGKQDFRVFRLRTFLTWRLEPNCLLGHRCSRMKLKVECRAHMEPETCLLLREL